MQVTQKRIGDRIEFFEGHKTDGMMSIATLFDGRSNIIFDQASENFSASIWDRPARDLATEFEAIGLTAETARMIDAMPIPDANV